MAIYTVSAAGTVGAGSDKLFEFDNVTIASGEKFKRCKIEIQGSYTSNARLRGNAQSVLGQSGWNTWTTDRTAISWPNNGKKPKVTVHNLGPAGYSWRVVVTIESEPKEEYNVNCSSGTGGSLTANKSKAQAGETVTLYPVANTGYELQTYLAFYDVIHPITITNNKFTMPAAAANITAVWRQVSFPITKAVSPAGAGSVSGASSAAMGESITLTQTPNSGYVFDGWQISTGTISSGGTFTMPAQAVTVTARYLKKSTATVNKTTLKGGDSAVLTISPEKSTFSHKYQMSFGTGMETEVTDVAAGTTAVTIQIPTSWANEIPNAATKGSGYIRVWTYNGSTSLGYVDVTGLTYQVPDDAIPDIGDIITSIVRTIDGTSYANVGDYYVQNHCGVRIQADAEGTYDATIASLAVSIVGYTGSEYSDTAADDEIDFTSGLLTNAGVTQIAVTATDSRGRTKTEYANITVEAYSTPSGTLHVWRTDSAGNANDVEEYANFALTKQFTEVGTNTLTATLGCNSQTEVTALVTGFLLPSSHQTFSGQSEHTVTLVLQDSFGETATITAILPSAKFIIHVAADGSRLAFFRAISKALNQLPAGKDSLIEIDDGTEVYFGNKKLEELMVLTDAQSLTAAQQSQAQGNIGIPGLLEDLFVVELVTLADNISCTANDSVATSYTFTPKSGYTPMCVVSLLIGNATNSGIGCTWVSCNYWTIINTNNEWSVYMQYRNHWSNVAKIKINVAILYRKNMT